MKYSSFSLATFSLLLLCQKHGATAFTVRPHAPSTAKTTQTRRSTQPPSLQLQESATSPEGSKSAEDEKPAAVAAAIKPDILLPFLPAADPMYQCRGPVGQDEFLLERTGDPRKEELSNENLLRILRIQCSDLEVNTLVWKCLGYRFNTETEEWTSAKVFPKWNEKYPAPPDLIGMQRIYSQEVDRPCLKANQSLVKSVPVDNKQSLKTHLKPMGFKGYQVSFQQQRKEPSVKEHDNTALNGAISRKKI
jgi:hypothetical protein